MKQRASVKASDGRQPIIIGRVAAQKAEEAVEEAWRMSLTKIEVKPKQN